MQLYPTSLNLTPEGSLCVAWSNGQSTVSTVRALREACPCATCREKRTAAQSQPPPLFEVLRPEETKPLKIDGMRPVGNYAYCIAFSDGHDTGIYTLERLHELGQPVSGEVA